MKRRFDWLGWGMIAGMAIFGPLYIYLRMTWEGYSDPLVLLAEQGRAVNCVKPLVYFVIFLGGGYLFVRWQFKMLHQIAVNAGHQDEDDPDWEIPEYYRKAFSEIVGETRKVMKR